MHHPMKRKRQRPTEWWQWKNGDLRSMVSIASLALLSSQWCTPTSAYVLSPTRVRKPHAYRPMRLETATTSMDEMTDEKTIHKSWLRARERQDDVSVSSYKLPPWLARLEEMQDSGDIARQVQWLEYALLEQDFPSQDVDDLINTMETAAAGDVVKFVGMVEFCHLLLQLEEPSTPHVFVTKEVLLASMLHYADCVTARQTGLYELVKKACKQCTIPLEERLLPESDQKQQHEQAHHDTETEEAEVVFDYDVSDSLSSSPLNLRLVGSEGDSKKVRKEAVANKGRAAVELQSSELGEEVMKIAQGAARIKQVEILAHAVLGEGRTPSMEEASRLRGLLLSVMDDWRALAIRSAASLYRLEGIFNANRGTAEYIERTPEVVQTARDALRIYAPLAQRLGMQRLKTQLEGLAFRILYRRQYGAVSKLYRQSGATWDAREAMQSVSTYLTKHIAQVLSQDERLTGELEDLKVTARVKEPFSLWKKLLKSRKKSKSQTKALVGESSSGSSLSSSQSELSVLEVLDAVALRIVLKARKWNPDEPDHITRERERLLCYYVQHVIREFWPAQDESRIKDYIKDPKPNGYQSLHHTSFISCFGENWPFEVQVRSQEMHRIAEYGVAAHWDYKLKGGKTVAQISPAQNEAGYTLSLPPAEKMSDDSISSVLPEPVVSVGRNGERDKATTSNDKPAASPEPVDSYVDALITAREDLVQQKVFVFFSGSSAIAEDGQLLSLPVGARVRDAVLRLEKELDVKLTRDNGMPQVYRNGISAELGDFVGTGDLLMVDM